MSIKVKLAIVLCITVIFAVCAATTTNQASADGFGVDLIKQSGTLNNEAGKGGGGIGGDGGSIDDYCDIYISMCAGEEEGGLICVNNPFGGENCDTNDGQDPHGDPIIQGPTIIIPLPPELFIYTAAEQTSDYVFEGYYEQPDESDPGNDG